MRKEEIDRASCVSQPDFITKREVSTPIHLGFVAPKNTKDPDVFVIDGETGQPI